MIVIVVLVSTLAYLLYKFSTRNYDYWEKRRVPYPKPVPFVGNVLEVFAFRISIGNALAKLYNAYKTAYFGIFVFNKPYLVLKSPELIKHILVKDFNYFPDRTMLCDEKVDSLASKHLFLATNPEWKFLRSKISSAFTAGKIRSMFPLACAICKEMNIYVDKNKDKPFIEVKELCSKYATEVATSCAFGVDAHCFENEDSEFRILGRKLFNNDFKACISHTSYFFAHGIVKLFKLRFLEASVTDFMRRLILSTIEDREKTGIKRNDVIDIMIYEKRKHNPEDTYKFEGDSIVAQAAQFFTAGLETVSTTMSFTLYELCLQPDIQKKLRDEIKDNVFKNGGITYEGIQEMKYLDKVICETLRKYPVLPFLDRMCIQDYKVPGEDLVIEKGTPVYIPMFGLHYDPDYFPDPEEYNPERFSDENIRKFPKYSYLPFGEGPRICVGKRFGLMASKLGLCYLLSNFEVVRCKNTPVSITFGKEFLLFSVGGLPMKFQESRIIIS